jgi:hypothetical protein
MELNFNICDKKEWKDYIYQSVKPIINCCSNLIEFNKLTRKKYSGEIKLSSSERVNKNSIKDKLIGKIGDDEQNKEINKRKFYKSFFGWYVEDLQQIRSQLKTNTKKDISVVLKKHSTQWTKFLIEIKNLFEKIIKSAYEKDLIPSPYLTDYTNEQELLRNHRRVIEEILSLYDTLAEFTINYNEKTLFIWTLRKNTKKFLEFQYKKLKENNCFQKIKELFGLKTFYSMDLEDEEYPDLIDKIKKAYTIYSISKDWSNNLAANIIALNDYIFDNFDSSESSPIRKYFQEIIPNLEDFKLIHQNKIKQLKPSWRIKEIYKCIKSKEKGILSYKYKLQGAFLTNFKAESSNDEKYNPINGKCYISFIEFLDGISTALFAGAIDLKEKNNWFWYENLIE